MHIRYLHMHKHSRKDPSPRCNDQESHRNYGEPRLLAVAKKTRLGCGKNTCWRQMRFFRRFSSCPVGISDAYCRRRLRYAETEGHEPLALNPPADITKGSGPRQRVILLNVPTSVTDRGSGPQTTRVPFKQEVLPNSRTCMHWYEGCIQYTMFDR